MTSDPLANDRWPTGMLMTRVVAFDWSFYEIYRDQLAG